MTSSHESLSLTKSSLTNRVNRESLDYLPRNIIICRSSCRRQWSPGRRRPPPAEDYRRKRQHAFRKRQDYCTDAEQDCEPQVQRQGKQKNECPAERKDNVQVDKTVKSELQGVDTDHNKELIATVD